MRCKPRHNMSDHNFNTPPELLDKIRRLDSEHGIGLDPCSNAMSLTDAGVEWYGRGSSGPFDIDGLRQSWREHRLVFMNPPHSMSPHNIEPWITKAWEEFLSPHQHQSVSPQQRLFDQFVGLVPAKTDTALFHDYVTQFPVRCFLRGRPKFWLNGAPMPGPGKFSSMLIYAGNRTNLFRDIFSDMGWIA